LKRHNYLQYFITDKDRYAHLIEKFDYSKDDTEKWSSIKMIKNVLGVLSLYFRNSSDASSSQRMKMVEDAIANKSLARAIRHYWEDVTDGASRFDKFILKAILQQSLLKLKWAFKYVHWRN